jgi:hypothetical protein
MARSFLPGCPVGSAFACPSVTACYGVVLPEHRVAELARTTDGGVNWQVRGSTPPDTSGNGNLACTSSTTCYYPGLDVIARTIDGGRTWTISHVSSPSCPSAEVVCHDFRDVTCPSPRTCFVGGIGADGGIHAIVAAVKNGGQTWQVHSVPGLGAAGTDGTVPATGASSVSCPTPTVCFALGWAGRIARTTNGGATWRLGHITKPYPFTGIACPSVTVCYAIGYLGRIMGTVNGSRTWHTLLPAIFVNSSWNPTKPRLHLYSPWFNATGPWRVTLGVDNSVSGPVVCSDAVVDFYVQNTAGKRIAGPMRAPRHDNTVWQYGRTVTITGRLRLEVDSARCPDFAVRIDGVE